MFFKRYQRKLDRLEGKIEKLAAAVQALASNNQSSGFDVGKFLEIMTNSQTSQIDSTSNFIKMIHEVSLERMAAALGKRGGRARARTAQRDGRGRMLPARTSNGACPLCDDSQTADFTMKQWEDHQSHRGTARGTSERREYEPEYQREQPAEHQHEHRATVQYPLPILTQPDGSSGAGSGAFDGNTDTARNGDVVQ